MPAAEKRLLPLAAIVAALGLLFMAPGWPLTPYALRYRLLLLSSMVLVGVAAGLSTVLFQTVTRTRILSPAVMGFESLFILIQTGIVFFLGSNGWGDWPPLLRFTVETLAMTGFSIVLYRLVFRGSQNDLYRLLLIGLILGIFFRSLSEFMQRMLAPNEFNALQGRLFASLTIPDAQLTAIAALVIAWAAWMAWRDRRRLDVLALGQDVAVALGVDYRRAVTRSLLLIAILVSASTALVGPLSFLGLVSATLAYQLAGTHRHGVVMPFAALVGIAFLAGGEMVLDRLFDMAGTLSVVIEFVGGGIFLGLLLRSKRL